MFADDFHLLSMLHVPVRLRGIMQHGARLATADQLLHCLKEPEKFLTYFRNCEMHHDAFHLQQGKAACMQRETMLPQQHPRTCFQLQLLTPLL